ncbi:MAG: hypothetical protein HXX12_11925 [Geothrix sp.]|uniref:hypothetical protein n=1 Tax=Geothrix sp. TaxID=1962974 RepID=UPI0018108963|nr:hypothetical protein [Geothrix sp.]NWJ41663.1 hypothetical protein [Geothrix sp.]WIL20355.1 MAG: hypothetical protein QOZ81_002920 [Geothrix sp.]
MFRPCLTVGLIAAMALPALARPDRPEDKERRREWKEEQKEDRHYWKEHDRREREYWKEREGRDHHAHRYEDDRDHDRGRRHVAPPWMNGYWRSDETRRYVALVPGDPSRMYVFLDGRWVLRQVRDPRARLDLEGAFRLPMAPPPIAPPRIGLDLHVVLFN